MKIIKVLLFICSWGAITIIFASSFFSSFTFDGYEITEISKTIKQNDILHIYAQKNAEQFVIELPYGIEDREKYQFNEGEKIIVQHIIDRDNQKNTYFIARYKLPYFLSLLSFIFLGILFVGSKKIIKAFLSFLFSIGILFGIFFPLLLQGDNIFLYGVVGSFVVAGLALLFTHGFSKLNTIGVFSLGITLIFAYILADISANIFSLFGTGGGDVSFLKNSFPLLDLQGIFLVGIFWGTLGMLDDVIMTQITATKEISLHQNSSWGKLFFSGMKVGTAHILSMINTLAFAYLASNISLLAYLYKLEVPWWTIMSMDIFLEESIRIIVGSLSLFIAVPISTFLAAIYLRKKLV